MKNGLRVIDADAHMQDIFASWVEMVEPEYYDRRPRMRIVDDENFHKGRRHAEFLPSELFPEPPRRRTSIQGGGANRQSRAQAKDFMPRKYGQSYEDEWTPESRLRDMAQFGWDKQVCIPDLGSLPFLRVHNRDQDLMWAVTRAYNTWARDFCSTDSSRLYAVAAIPDQHDVDGLVAEARRAVAELNHVTVMMPAPAKGLAWEDPAYDPFWALAEELDFPLSFHGASSGTPHTSARYQPRHAVPGQQVALDHATGFPFENMLALGHVIYMGLLERFPKMRVSFLEGNAGWLPWWLSRLDDHALESRRQGMWFDAPLLPLAPSEYFRRQGFVACDGDEGSLPGVVALGWGEHVVWNTDYPHTDAPDPDVALDSFLAQPISEEAKRQILWDNAVRLYGRRIEG